MTLTQAHPRSRGENAAGVARRIASRGSSPLTRGKPRLAAYVGDVPGLIPAHAGKTVSAGECDEREGAHPRSRGENGCTSRVCLSHTGSSPLTRGKLSISGHTCVVPRLIPAHAGKTTVPEATHAVSPAHPRSRGEN